MAFQKTKEQIAEEQRLLAERYPETLNSEVDPTQPTRDFLKRFTASAFIPESPLGRATEDMRQAGLPKPPKPEYEMSPDIKKYGYDLFGIKDIAGDVEQQIPFAPNENEAQRSIAAIEAPEVVELKKPQITINKIQPEMQDTKQIPGIQETAAKNIDIEDMIKQSQEEEDRAALWKQSAKLRDAIMGAGLGRVKETDVSMYEDLEKKAKRPIQNLLLKQELEDKKSKADPNSNISKFIRKSLSDLGMEMTGLESLSYAQIEKLYPSVANAMMTKLATETRKQEAAITRDLKEEAKKEASYEKTRTIVNNKIGKLQEAKTSPFAGYNQAKQTTQMIDNAIEAWDNSDENAKIKNSVAFMQYAKIAQGDDSVVRSSDMQALAGGLNYSSPYALLNKFAAKTEGSPFTKDELLEMKKVIDTIRKVKKNQLQQRLDPIILDAQRGGYDLDQSISPDIIEDIYSPEPLSIADKAKRLEELRKKQGK